ncbi:MAG: hypothetical protein COA57_15065 [Flavobacteriales bacterium]|nr:MAG: hypothetical protein COA57_15065 [Flavobacteriales bacterium]
MKTTLLIAFLTVAGAVQAQSWWAQTSNTTEDLMNINFYNNNTGMAFGDTLSTMVKTSNQGVLWSELSPVFTAGELLSSSYLDANTIIAVGVHDISGGDGLVMKSANGGSTWTTDTNIPEKLFDVDFATSTNGWISGENGYIARTTDGGTSWQQQTTATGEDIFSIDFVDANEGWAVGTVDSIAVILHTTNAGTNWTMQVSGVNEPLFSVFFVDNMNGWAVGANGTIIATTDGGTTWAPQTSGVLNDLFSVSFVSASHAWAVGSSGTILRTTDSGNTWTSQTSTVTGDINSIKMLTVNTGWFCGKNGQIYYYGFPTEIPESNISNINFKIYPNPNDGNFELRIENEELRNAEVTIYNVLGERVYETYVRYQVSGIRIDISSLPKGVYFLQLKTAAGTVNRKIMLQ